MKQHAAALQHRAVKACLDVKSGGSHASLTPHRGLRREHFVKMSTESFRNDYVSRSILTVKVPQKAVVHPDVS